MANNQDKNNQCAQWIEFISAYIDGQIDDEQAEKLEEHLRQCPHCREICEQYSQIKELMQADRHECPADIASLVLSSIERNNLLNGLDSLAKPTQPIWIKLLKITAAAAMIGLAFSAIFIVMRFANPSETQRSAEMKYKSYITNKSNITQKPYIANKAPAIAYKDKHPTSISPSAIKQTPSALAKRAIPKMRISTQRIAIASEHISQKSKQSSDTEQLAGIITENKINTKIATTLTKQPKQASSESTNILAKRTVATPSQKSLTLMPAPKSPSPDKITKSSVVQTDETDSLIRAIPWKITIIADTPMLMLLKEQLTDLLLAQNISQLQASDIPEAIKQKKNCFYKLKYYEISSESHYAEFIVLADIDKISALFSALTEEPMEGVIVEKNFKNFSISINNPKNPMKTNRTNTSCENNTAISPDKIKRSLTRISEYFSPIHKPIFPSTQENNVSTMSAFLTTTKTTNLTTQTQTAEPAIKFLPVIIILKNTTFAQQSDELNDSNRATNANLIATATQTAQTQNANPKSITQATQSANIKPASKPAHQIHQAHKTHQTHPAYHAHKTHQTTETTNKHKHKNNISNR